MSNLILSAHVGIPGSLTVDIQSIANIANARPPVIYPRLREPVLVGKPDLISQSWGVNFMTPVVNRLNALGGALIAQLLGLECPSVDTTDMAWGATGSVNATDNPVTVTTTLFGTSMFGRTFQPGDYVIWDDSSSANGLYQYEIDQILAVNGNVLTLSRSQQGQPTGQAYFGTVRAGHSGMNIFRMLNPTFYQLWDGSEQTFKFLWDGMIVSAIFATYPDGSRGLLNLIPIPPATAAMGLIL